VARSWGFELTDVETPVLLWHGEDDRTWSPAVGRHLAASLPRCQATFVPVQGHLAFVTVWTDVLVQLVAGR
jgi:pimeloyl-ACP methyl ester carboxylesterase